MNTEVKEKWVAALRSGGYTQGYESLKFEKTFCCLGVLCDLFLKEHPDNAKWNCYEFEVKINKVEEKESLNLPDAVLRWAELPRPLDEKETREAKSVLVTYANKSRTLPYLNDNLKLTFDEIATTIERCL